MLFNLKQPEEKRRTTNRTHSQDLEEFHFEASSLSVVTDSDMGHREWSTIASAPAISTCAPRLPELTLGPLSLGDPNDTTFAQVQISPNPASLQSLALIPPAGVSAPKSYHSGEARIELVARAQQALSLGTDILRWSSMAHITRQSYLTDPMNHENINQFGRPARSTVVRGILDALTGDMKYAEALRTAAMDELSGASKSTLAEVFRLTALEGMQSGSHRQLIFTPDSSMLATMSSDDSVSLWSTKEHALVHHVQANIDGGESAAVSSKSWQLDNEDVAFSSNSLLRVAVTALDSACRMDASLDGNVASGGFRGALRQRMNAKPMKQWAAEEVRCIAFSPAGDQLVAGTSQGALLIWDIAMAKVIKRIKTRSNSDIIWVEYSSFSQNKTGSCIAAAGDYGWLCFWELETRSILPDRWVPQRMWDKYGDKKVSRIQVLEKQMSDLVVSKSFSRSDNKEFARVAVGGQDGSIMVWYCETDVHWLSGLSREWILAGHDENITNLAFSPNSELLVTASHGAVKIWQVRGGLPVATIRAQSSQIVFSHDSCSLASTSQGNLFHIWDAKRIQNLSDTQDHLDRAVFVATSGDGRYMASVAGKSQDEDVSLELVRGDPKVSLMIWDVDRTKPMVTLISTNETEILLVSFSDDSTRMASISSDDMYRLHIWDVESGQSVDTMAPLRHADSGKSGMASCGVATLSPSLRYCAMVFYYSVDGFSIGDQIVENIKLAFGVSLYDICSPDGDEAQHSDNSTRGSCKALVSPGVVFEIIHLTFSPDAARLAALDTNHAVTLWDTSSGDVVMRLCDPSQALTRYQLNPASDGNHSWIEWLDSNAREQAHGSGRLTLQFSASGRQISFLSNAGFARIWSLDQDGQEPRTMGNDTREPNLDDGTSTSQDDDISHVYSTQNCPVAVSPDGTRCIAYTDGIHIALWDVNTSSPVATLGYISDVHHVSFSPDSRWLITGSDKHILVCYAETGEWRTKIAVGLSWPLRMVMLGIWKRG